ncbi:MAG TPA: SIMPL domain-containing protein [Trebonia sp.]
MQPTTEQLPVISVRGETWLEAEPEIAVVAVTVQARDRDRRTVLDRLAARHDFTVLGELVARLADLELVTVAGPWWALRPDSPVHRQARIAAAGEATRRAGEYAEAFGGRLGDLIEAADTGLLDGQGGHGGRESRGFAAAARPGPGGHPGEAPILDLEPVRQSVTAQVEARFVMTRPPSPR